MGIKDGNWNLKAFSSLARQEPKLLGNPIVVELAEKYKTSPQVNGYLDWILQSHPV